MAHRDTSAALPLALTMGEPSGIGLDITLSAWNAREQHALPPFCFYGDGKALAERARALGCDAPIVPVSRADEAAAHFHHAIPVRAIPVAATVVAGAPDPLNAHAVITAIETAVSDVKAGYAAAVVTNPISKAVLYEAGFNHPGHTEFLASLAARYWPGKDYHPVMMLSGKDLKVVPLTIHIPLSEVPRRITRPLIEETVRIVAAALTRDFAISRPRIAVAGLNPHAGEDGTMGREDIDIIAPALAALRIEGLDLVGPLPADTMFHDAARARYDAAICMYHDQALIPVKTLAFDEGVNTTLGLPFARTSPDHGTALSLAATGKASALSLIQAIKLAYSVAIARRKLPV